MALRVRADGSEVTAYTTNIKEVSNQIEMQKLNDYIELLQSLLDKNEIEYPDI